MSEKQQPVSGYVVGTTPDGQIIFEILGEPKPGLFALLGAHAYAAYEIKKIEDAFHKYGPVQIGHIMEQLLRNIDITIQGLRRDMKTDSTLILDTILNPKGSERETETTE